MIDNRYEWSMIELGPTFTSTEGNERNVAISESKVQRLSEE
jgi:hypothetical protein